MLLTSLFKSFAFILGIDDRQMLSVTTSLLYLNTLEIRNPITLEKPYNRTKGKMPMIAMKIKNNMAKK